MRVQTGRAEIRRASVSSSQALSLEGGFCSESLTGHMDWTSICHQGLIQMPVLWLGLQLSLRDPGPPPTPDSLILRVLPGTPARPLWHRVGALTV